LLRTKQEINLKRKLLKKSAKKNHYHLLMKLPMEMDQDLRTQQAVQEVHLVPTLEVDLKVVQDLEALLDLEIRKILGKEMLKEELKVELN